MEKHLGADIASAERRKEFLADNCDAVEEKGYMKQYTNEELAEMKDQLSDTAIKINDIEIEKKMVNDEFKVRLKPLKKHKDSLLDGLKNKAKHVNEQCYKFIDMETREVGFYNADGKLIESRPAYANELQGTIFQINRTGTND